MKRSALIFIGIKGSVIALNRTTGQQVWATHLKGIDFVNILVQDGSVLATCAGEIFCLHEMTGNARWHNPLKGFGRGFASMATEGVPSDSNAPAAAAKRRRDDEVAASTAAVTASS